MSRIVTRRPSPPSDSPSDSSSMGGGDAAGDDKRSPSPSASRSGSESGDHSRSGSEPDKKASQARSEDSSDADESRHRPKAHSDEDGIAAPPEQRGRLTRWFEHRGYGFVQEEGKTDPSVFVHRRDFVDTDEPQRGDALLYCVRDGTGGKPEAFNVRFAERFRRPKPAAPRPKVEHVVCGTVKKWNEEKGF
eukprot:gene5481-5133_t